MKIGHGKHGEKASKMASDYFQKALRSHLSQQRHVSMREHEKTMRNIFEGAHKKIIMEYETLTTLEYDGYVFGLKVTADRVDFYSAPDCPYVLLQDFGTTAVVCVYWEETQKLMVANCGDSDALIGRWDFASGQLQPNLLAISDNVACTNNGEQDRIRRDFGRKTKFGGGYLSPNDITYGFHSLAMTRALGHKFLEKYGVTWDPHIRLFQITPEDVVLVVASDGLFDVVNSKAVLAVAAEKNIIDGQLRTLVPEESSKTLVQLALGNWKKQFNSIDVADNTTVCVLKLSNQFDDHVPERDELASSGTTFSPAHAIFHAFETEIEETPRDNLEADDGEIQSEISNTPVLADASTETQHKVGTNGDKNSENTNSADVSAECNTEEHRDSLKAGAQDPASAQPKTDDSSESISNSNEKQSTHHHQLATDARSADSEENFLVPPIVITTCSSEGTSKDQLVESTEINLNAAQELVKVATDDKTDELNSTSGSTSNEGLIGASKDKDTASEVKNGPVHDPAASASE